MTARVRIDKFNAVASRMGDENTAAVRLERAVINLAPRECRIVMMPADVTDMSPPPREFQETGRNIQTDTGCMNEARRSRAE
jgi:hypothetical protein